MRLTDDRYAHERDRCELALRLLRHEARTSLIRICTGISEDRVRKLYKTYIRDRSPIPLRRKRGKAPQELTAFTRNALAHLEASVLAGVLQSLDLLDAGIVQPLWRPSMTFGRHFCDAFEYYLDLVNNPQFTFEHAWFLMQTLSRGIELRLTSCARCSAPHLQDLLSTTLRSCPFCERKPLRLTLEPRATP